MCLKAEKLCLYILLLSVPFQYKSFNAKSSKLGNSSQHSACDQVFFSCSKLHIFLLNCWFIDLNVQHFEAEKSLLCFY